MAEPLKLTASESVTILQSTPEMLEVEASYGPGGQPPPAHFHPSQDERFEVLEGSLQSMVGGEERELGRGETIEIAARTPHQSWNPGAEPARVRWQTRPGLRTEAWFRALDRLQREGKVSASGAPRTISILPLLFSYRDVFRVAIRR